MATPKANIPHSTTKMAVHEKKGHTKNPKPNLNKGKNKLLTSRFDLFKIP